MRSMAHLLRLLNSSMPEPELYGWFHILWLVITVAFTVYLCRRFPDGKEKQVRIILLAVSVMVILLECYKQINYTFKVTNAGTINADYQWYAFPFQFCSTPMYVGLLAAVLPKGRIHRSLCAYLASYAVFAGLCVMVYPADVFIGTIGINIQTMICHGTMISIGVYLLYTGYVPATKQTVLRAIPVFSVAVAIAAGMNEVAFHTGLLKTETFNMFFISPYCEPSLPVYSWVQKMVSFPWCLILYILAFSVASALVVLVAALIKKAAAKRVKCA